MQSLWSQPQAAQVVARYAEQGVAEDLALRVYSSRLLGTQPQLVQHGGGNTSLKTAVADLFGARTQVLCVKGSGWDLGDIEPQGLPAVRLAPLLDLRRLSQLSDEAMVDAQRGALLSATAPNPSVETLLHAWIPHRYIDHTHANAVLALCDQPQGEARCRDVWGERLAYVPYCMAGFALAQLAAAAFDAHPQAEGMILLKHGIFTWGDSARQAYEAMIGLVSQAEAQLAATSRTLAQVKLPPIAPLAEIAPAVRGALAQALDGRGPRPVVLAHRTSPAILAFAAGQAVSRYAQAGPVTPDHVIRIKPWPLLLPPPAVGGEAAFAQEARRAVASYADRYRAYFERHNARADPRKTMLDPWPRWALVPGLGLFGAGASAKEAGVAADVAETTIAVITAAERIDRFESISPADLFDMEYWSLEQAKLGKAKPAPLAGQIAAVTGGGGAIGAAIAKALAAAGAQLAVLDRDGAAAARAAAAVKGLALVCDVTDAAAVRAAFARISETYGGLDILVSNAGAAFTGAIGEVDEALLRRSFELNFFAHQSAAQAAVRIMRRQASGGVLLFNVSKQAVNPGPDFGPYGLPKAATLALMRQYAVDYGAQGIRANAVNADRIRSGLLTDAMIKARALARGVGEREYLSGNLLGREVLADDVAAAFVSLALAQKTTAAVLTVDGGNIAAALR
jgi:rhamnose utilization protein RhaD (predicted bifunctional aldolase and dehydrogenase)/NAD(P)-dependent dehydrogenase (short-subunit alcohol dehydrogenase family)